MPANHRLRSGSLLRGLCTADRVRLRLAMYRDRIAIPDRIFLLMTISFIYTNRVKSRFAEHFTGRVDKPAVFAYYNRNKGVVCPFGKKRTALTRRVRPACA